MTDQTDALRMLIGAVRAENPDRLSVLEYAGNWAHAFGNAGLYVYALDACFGSLDAAKALHDNVLPGWDWGRTEGNIYVKDPRRGSRSTKWGGPNEIPARAWLIAILEALIAKDTAND